MFLSRLSVTWMNEDAFELQRNKAELMQNARDNRFCQLSQILWPNAKHLRQLHAFLGKAIPMAQKMACRYISRKKSPIAENKAGKKGCRVTERKIVVKHFVLHSRSQTHNVTHALHGKACNLQPRLAETSLSIYSKLFSYSQ
jgi:hypothetical protein